MATIFRVIARGGASIGEADTLDGVVELVKGASPGHYRIDKVAIDLATGDLRSWDWGAITKSRKGRITLDLPPWLD